MGRERVVSGVKERAVSAIREYADAYLEAPEWRMRNGGFELASYNRWAVEEILRSIEKSGSVHPFVAIEDFVRRMDGFSCRDSKGSIVFSMAHDMAENILDILLVAMKPDELKKGETENEEDESFADSEGDTDGAVEVQP